MLVTITEQMEVDRIFPKIKQLFECQLCDNTLTFPVQAQCGHLFCSPCLKKLPVKQAMVTCPTCKNRFHRRIQKQRDDFQDLLSAFHNLVGIFKTCQTTEALCVTDENEELTTCGNEGTVNFDDAEGVLGQNLLAENEEDELFISTQAVNLKVPQSCKSKELTPKALPVRADKVSEERKIVKTNNNEGRKIVKTYVFEEIKIAKTSVSEKTKFDKTNVSEETKIVKTNVSEKTKIVKQNISSGGPERDFEDCPPEALDLTMKLNTQQSRTIKRPRYGFASVEPSLALDLSRNSKAGGQSNRLYENVKSFSRKKLILNPVRYYHLFGLPEPRSKVLAMSEMGKNSQFQRFEMVNPQLPKINPSSEDSCNAAGSENSDKIFCEALDLVSQEVNPVITDSFMPSGDDAILNEATDIALIFNSDSARSNSSVKRANEESASNSIEKRLKMAEEQDGTGVAETVFENVENAEEQMNLAVSDNESEDMFLCQTPTSEKGSPFKSNDSTPASIKKDADNRTLKSSNMSMNLKTPANVSLFCTSPPSGALSTTIGHFHKDDYDPFAEDFGELHNTEATNENQTKNSNDQVAGLTLQRQTLFNSTSKTPVKTVIHTSQDTTPKSDAFGKLKSAGNLNEVSTPKHWTSPSRQNCISPSRSLLGRSQKDKYYLSALSPKSPVKIPKNYVFCPTRLSSFQINQLRLLCGMCGGKIIREFTDEVTHLILTLEDGRVPQTMKYLFAIAGQKWVLTFDWVEECLKQKKIVREGVYETSCDPGVKASRLATVPLFHGFTFHVLGDFRSSGAKDSDWKRLLKKLGAAIISGLDNVEHGTIIVGDSSDSAIDYADLYKTRKVITVAWEWILDCVLNYSLLPISKTEYVVTPVSAEELREVGLPEQLIPEI